MKSKKRYIKSPFMNVSECCAGCGVGLPNTDDPTLHFEVKRSPGGWFAQCLELEEYFIGGSNPNPTETEISDALDHLIHVILESKS